MIGSALLSTFILVTAFLIAGSWTTYNADRQHTRRGNIKVPVGIHENHRLVRASRLRRVKPEAAAKPDGETNRER